MSYNSKYTGAQIEERIDKIDGIEQKVNSASTPESVAVQISNALTNYVQKVTGKDLSTNDFTNELKSKLDNLSNYDDTTLQQSITALTNRIDTLVGTSASEAIDTFNEIEAFLAGITDTQTLTGLLNTLKSEIVAAIPTKTSALINDSGFITSASLPTKNSELENDSNFATVSQIPTKVSELTNDKGYLVAETDPTVPSWAKQPNKPTYTASEVGALASVPKATPTVYGGFLTGYTDNGKFYGVQLDSEGKAYVNVPWTDTNTVYTHPTFTAHNSGLYKITVDSNGHVSGAVTVTKDDITALGIPAQDTVYTHPSYAPREAGLYKVTVDSTGHVSNAAVVTKADITSLGIPAQDTIYTHPSYTAQANGMYKITVDTTGHVSGVSAITKTDITALGIPAQDTVYDDSSLANRVSSLESGKVEKIDGKGLSTNDFTNEYKTKLDNADEVCVSAGVLPTGTQEVWIDTSDQDLDQTLLTDAPSNGKQYVRRDGAWVEWYDNQSIVPTRLSVVTSLESLPIDYYSIKATVSAATTMSFAATPMEGMEFMIDVLNSSAEDIEQALPNADGWQSSEKTVTLVAGAVTPISVRYIHGIYCIRV